MRNNDNVEIPKIEMVSRTREALDAFSQLLPEEQLARLIAAGAIAPEDLVCLNCGKTVSLSPPRWTFNPIPNPDACSCHKCKNCEEIWCGQDFCSTCYLCLICCRHPCPNA